MLAKKYRLVFTGRWQGGRSFKTAHLLFRLRANEFAWSRFGVAVSRAVEKSAVSRNRIRRCVYDFLRVQKAHAIPGFDVLIIALKGVQKVPREELKKELQNFISLF